MFRLLNYTCQVIRQADDDSSVSNPGITRIAHGKDYTEEVIDRRIECNILDLIRDEVKMKINMGQPPFSSWVLARFWRLTNGTIMTGLNVEGKKTGRGRRMEGGSLVAFR